MLELLHSLKKLLSVSRNYLCRSIVSSTKEKCSVSERAASPGRGCSKGLGCYPSKQKRISGGIAGSPFLAFVGTNALLAQ